MIPLFRSGLVRAACLVALFSCSALLAAAAEAVRAFDVPAGDAAATLKQAAKQGGVEIVFPAATVSGVQTAPVKGDFTAREAINRMLADTDLVLVQDEKSGVLSVQRLAPDAKNAASRLAEAQTADDADAPAGQGRIRDGVVQLDAFEVFGSKSINLDIPRSRDDAQPYVVFDRDQISGSQATNIQDFFRTRLPMATWVGQLSFAGGSALNSTVNLRGLGVNQTLILVDGRRLPAFSIGASTSMLPPNINGIPLGMIERIEVLPSTASGIYGGGATGGVINIITRKDYSGAELTLNYVNTFDTDTARRGVELNASTSLRGGATVITLTASYKDANDLLTQDRDFAVRARQLILANNPAAFTGPASPPRGYTTNIRSQTGANLQLKPQFGGTMLSSFFTSVPVGYAGITSDNAAALVANAGRYNLDLPDDLRGGRSNLITKASPNTSLGLGVRQKITPWLEGYVDYLRTGDYTHSASFAPTVTSTLAANAPNNPFTTAVNVAFPFPGLYNNSTDDVVVSRVTGGLVAKLPREWQAGLDYVWARSAYHSHVDTPVLGDPDGPTGPQISFSTALATGALDVLRDLNVRPLDYGAYVMAGQVFDNYGANVVQSLTLRASGPAFRLPAGDMMISTSADWQESKNEPSVFAAGSPAAPGTTYRWAPEISSQSKSAYVEARVPLLGPAASEASQPRLELQVAGRYDSSEVTTLGLSSLPSIAAPDGPFPTVPFVTRDFSASSYTAGLRYAPLPDVVLRASIGTGFLAPDTSQLNPGFRFENRTVAGISDPKRGGVPSTIGPLAFVVGGNPDLRPERSTSTSAGVIFTPRFLPGFRLSVDYTKIEKTDEITALGFQLLLDFENQLPGAVTRAALTPADQALGYTGGVITVLNLASVNFARRTVEAFDFQADYTFKNSLGEWRGYGVATLNRLFAGQVTPTTPLGNELGYLGSPLKWRGNVGLDWARGRWSAGWNAVFYDSQFIYAFTATPVSRASSILNQGGDRWPAQFYHDAQVSYQFGRDGRGWRRLVSDLKVTVGLQNVFNREPSLQAGVGERGGFQNIEDPRLRRYSLTLKKHF